MGSATDQDYMHRCLQLAKLGIGNTAPNPMVGAVLLHNGCIIGEGYHRQYGQNHAEANCIHVALQNSHGDKFPKSVLYVSLEPCAHYGKTPPCADLIVKHQIPKVVIGCKDVFAKVNGAGVAILKQAGIDVVENVLQQECVAVNKRFFTFHTSKRPYIVLKWAQTADGFMAPSLQHPATQATRLLISNDYSNRLVHQWRTEEAAIMIGANTAIADDPLLDNRLWAGKPPVKIVADPHLRVPNNLRMFQQGEKVIVLNCLREEENENLSYHIVNENNFLNESMSQLYANGIQSILVEGGTTLLQSFISAGLWDEARVITNTKLFIEKGLGVPNLSRHILINEKSFFDDQIRFFKNQGNTFI